MSKITKNYAWLRPVPIISGNKTNSAKTAITQGEREVPLAYQKNSKQAISYPKSGLNTSIAVNLAH